MLNKKSEYIYVRSINDIDPKKLTIRDLNKKFIDEHGRKYAVQFDFTTREIKFVRIASSYQEAIRIKQEILNQKDESWNHFTNNDKSIYDTREYSTINPSMEKTNEEKKENKKTQDNFLLDSYFDLESPVFDENEFYTILEKKIKKSVESIKAIEKNLNRVQIFEKNTNSLHDFFELQKQIELKCYNLSEEALKILKELVYYPRNAAYYYSKLPDPVRKQIENWEEKQQLEYIKRYEIYRIFSELLKHLKNIINQLEQFYYMIPELEREKKPLIDLLPSFAEVKETILYLTEKINTWYTNYQKS